MTVIRATVGAMADPGNLRAIASRVEYTKPPPPPAIPPSGKYEHEKVFVRAIVVDNGSTRAALVTRLWTQDANPTAPSDKAVAVLKFESPAGEPTEWSLAMTR